MVQHALCPTCKKLYKGNIDDMTMLDQCDIMDHGHEGDAFPVDRVFTVQEILLCKQATIFIPVFIDKRGSTPHKTHCKSTNSRRKIQLTIEKI